MTGGESLFLYNLLLLLFITSSVLELRSASAVSAKRHTRARAALRLDNIWGREIVRLEGELWMKGVPGYPAPDVPRSFIEGT